MPSLRYQVEVPPSTRKYSRDDLIILWGSCFAHELKRHLYEELYQVGGSPYGIMYNPLSMANALERVLLDLPPTEEALFLSNNEWHSFMHHGTFSHYDKEQALVGMQTAFHQAKDQLSSAKLLVLTFGTAFVYCKKTTGEVVSNCHKLPTNQYFQRRRATVQEMTQRWLPLLEKLRQHYPSLQILFTISPIPHYRDGAHQSRLSKATLHLLVDKLLYSSGTSYFPAYEIMQDELRDYRFYQSDYAHPTPEAVLYIIQRFTEAYLQPNPDFDNAWHRIRLFAQHHPLTTYPDSITAHYGEAEQQLLAFQEQHPHPFITELLQSVRKEYE